MAAAKKLKKGEVGIVLMVIDEKRMLTVAIRRPTRKAVREELKKITNNI